MKSNLEIVYILVHLLIDAETYITERATYLEEDHKFPDQLFHKLAMSQDWFQYYCNSNFLLS